MIKINLLGAAPPPPKPVGAPSTAIVMQVVVFLGALIICFGIVGVIYRLWSRKVADLQQTRSREKLRETELAAVKAQNAQYRLHLQDLETRINTIQALQASRVGPVELMSSLGNVVNESNDVYLYTLVPLAGRYQLKGQSGTVDSMATFMASLKKSGSFNDVRLEQFYEDDQHERLTYKFTLSCEFVSAAAGSTPAAGGAPAGPGGPGRGPSGAPGGLPGVPAQVQQSLRRGS